MTFSSSEPVKNTPEAKLASKSWRYLNSWWILPPVLSLGLLGWLGFLIAGIQTGKKSYLAFAAGYAAALVGALAAPALILVPWLVPTVHAALVNGTYLQELARSPSANSGGSQTPQGLQPPPGRAANQERPRHATASTSKVDPDPAAYWAHDRQLDRPSPPSPGMRRTGETGTAYEQGGAINVYIDTATVADLTQLPGVDAALAQRIVAARDARNGYRNFEDLVDAAKVPPHVALKIRDHLLFKAGGHGPGQAGSGRVVDF
ncbi:ComEA family DNA-binding protein [Citricoccus sp. CH26A]|uniref:ComEA family DNA-binding protein n=1 Tax=Citricoccus TaxID=169133 RepID=UPI0009FEDA79|nr:helix-hairpin-helix domain-containing protein [Citricoccus sp. CH26A]